MQKGLDGHLCTATSAVVDPALLAKVDTNRRVSRCFDLRMSEFVTADAFDENVEPTKRKSRRSLTLKRKTVSTASSCAKKPRKALRPRNETISEADYSDMAVPFVPNQWAYNNFIVWRDEFVGKLTTVCELQVLLKCLELGYPRRSFRSIQATVLRKLMSALQLPNTSLSLRFSLLLLMFVFQTQTTNLVPVATCVGFLVSQP